MSLLLCGYCKDVRALSPDEVTACRCGKTRGRYRDDHWHADLWGDDGVLLGLENDDVLVLLGGRLNDESAGYTETPIRAQPPWHPRAHYHETAAPDH